MQSIHDLSHLGIIFQKAQSRISMVFIAYKLLLVKLSSSPHNLYFIFFLLLHITVTTTEGLTATCAAALGLLNLMSRTRT